MIFLGEFTFVLFSYILFLFSTFVAACLGDRNQQKYRQRSVDFRKMNGGEKRLVEEKRRETC